MINHQWVVTAAHCLIVNIDKIRLGEFHLGADEPVLDSEVIQVIQHPKYSSSHLTHDIAMVKLQRPVAFSRGIQVFKKEPMMIIPHFFLPSMLFPAYLFIKSNNTSIG